jgi:hypothetical protein
MKSQVIERVVGRGMLRRMQVLVAMLRRGVIIVAALLNAAIVDSLEHALSLATSAASASP